MWLTIIGCFLIILSCAAFGFRMADAYRIRILRLQEIVMAFRVIRNEICVFNGKLPLLLEKMTQEKAYGTHCLFQNVMHQFYKNTNSTLSQAVEVGVRKSVKHLCLGKEEEQILIYWGRILERSDREGLMKSMDDYMEQLLTCEVTVREEMTKNQKLYQIGGILSGLLVSILCL